jgi:hypothetical protein
LREEQRQLRAHTLTSCKERDRKRTSQSVFLFKEKVIELYVCAFSSESCDMRYLIYIRVIIESFFLDLTNYY